MSYQRRWKFVSTFDAAINFYSIDIEREISSERYRLVATKAGKKINNKSIKFENKAALDNYLQSIDDYDEMIVTNQAYIVTYLLNALHIFNDDNVHVQMTDEQYDFERKYRSYDEQRYFEAMGWD